MNANVILKDNQALGPDGILKVTALVYFKEALQQQEYETCAQLVSIAKKFGASQEEIQDTIAALLQGDKPGGQNEAQKGKNRLGFLKENT